MIREQKSFATKFLIFLQLFLGVGAVFGGMSLIIDPTGNLIQMPISLLEHSPFNNFLIPAIILLLMLGFLPLATAIGLIQKNTSPIAEKLNLFKNKNWAWTYSLYIGFILIIWISIQVYFIKTMGILHMLYIFWGLLIQAVTLLPTVQKYYSNKQLRQ